MKKKNKGKMAYMLQLVSMIPLLFLGVMIMILGYRQFTKAMYDEVELALQGTAASTLTLLEALYPGDYMRIGDRSYEYYKGDQNLAEIYDLLDQVKSDTGLDVTLFFQNLRIMTTIYDSSGSRYVGTGAGDMIRREVLKADQGRFYSNAMVDGVAYFSYYMPVHNSDGSVTGMLFVGKPKGEVDDVVQRALYPLLAAVLLAIILMTYVVIRYTQKIVEVLLKIKVFLAEVAVGNMDAEIDPMVLNRNDELGEMGQSVVATQQAIREMVEMDTLTKIFNRSSANRRLKQVMEKSKAQKTPFAIAIGDIDFFKKVNDTYGHDCGDMVLKAVADAMREHMKDKGFVARWGGEEFLLVFEKMDGERAAKYLQQMLEAIRELRIPYKDQVVSLTMTFGVTDGKQMEMKDLLCRADQNLYEGKETGRNKVVYW